MPRFAANLSLLFTELPFLERFSAAAQAGFHAVEFQFPFDFPADCVAQELKAHRLRAVLLNSLLGTRPTDRGLGAVPGREKDFWTIFEQSLAYARTIHCPRLRIVAGYLSESEQRREMEQVLTANLRRAAPVAAADNVTLLLEPLNRWDAPGYLLSTTEQALSVIDRVGYSNVKLQLDFYHCQRSEGDLAGHAERLLGRYDHVQISNSPGRHEPGVGEIHYPFLLAWLDQLGYEGWVGCEYHPSTTTLASLSWAHEYGLGRCKATSL